MPLCALKCHRISAMQGVEQNVEKGSHGEHAIGFIHTDKNTSQFDDANNSVGLVESERRAMQEPNRILYDRKSAALMLSISIRSLDYLIAGKLLTTRRIGKKVLIPHGELVRFSRADHYTVTPK